jgi:hypothetical protein
MQRIAIGLTVNGHRADAKLLARADHSQRNLAAIGDQNLPKHAFPSRLWAPS